MSVRELAEALEALGARWWYLSFADPHRPTGEQWLGGCVVAGIDIGQAVRTAAALSCNPGGEVAALEVPREFVDRLPDEHVGRLITDRAVVAQLGQETGGSA
jgi:hypothetical protein